MSAFTQIGEDEIKKTIEGAASYSEAAAILGVHIKTVCSWAKKVGILSSRRQRTANSYDLQDILDGKHPQYPTSHLAKRLVSEGIKEWKCEECQNTKWLNQKIPLDLDHKDGDNHNHKIENLRFLCPNCHSLTDTYKSKNKLIRRLGRENNGRLARVD